MIKNWFSLPDYRMNGPHINLGNERQTNQMPALATQNSETAGLFKRIAIQFLRTLIIKPLRTYFRYVPFRLAKQFLWKYAANRLWWLEANVKTQTRFGSKVYVNAKDIIGRYIYYFGLWEPNLTGWVSRRLAAGDGFIDIGANIGYYSLLASRRVGPSGRVVAIEPFPQFCGIIERNLMLNDVHNVRVVPMAAWDQEETVTIFTKLRNPEGVTSVMPSWAKHWRLEEYGEVPARPLSKLLSSEEVMQARVIKVDVEGAEWRVLRGMETLLERGRRDLEVIVEVSPAMLRVHGETMANLVAFFEKFGFYAYRIDNDYRPEAYFSIREVSQAVRLTSVPSHLFQLDLIFSRTDASAL
jgi:FkbM family methyltransferase